MTPDRKEIIQTSLRIRAFEQHLLKAFNLGLLRGTTHTCIGQELTPSIVGKLFPEGSFVVSNHRNHGHFLGIGGSPTELLLEIAGSVNGISSGYGGSQHVHSNNFLSHGILGGMVPFAVGKGIARKLSNREDRPIIVFLGDGTFGEGVLYEALNLAALFNSCILFIVENNRMSQSTPTETVIVGDIFERCKSIVSDCSRETDREFSQLYLLLEAKLRFNKDFSQPRVVMVQTERLGPHSKGTVEIDPWLSAMDPVFQASLAESITQFRQSAYQVYTEISEIFNDVLDTDVFETNFFQEWAK